MVLHSSPQEDDIWKSQWPGAVHQRIWTRAWCQKIKRFALLFLSISVNICRAALFPAGVKIGKVFDSFQICFKPNRGDVGDWPVLRQNPSLAQFPIQILLFWSSWTLRSMSSLWEFWSCQGNLAGMEVSAAELVIKPAKLWSWDAEELQLSTCFPPGWDLLLVLLFSSGKGSVSKWLQAVPCLSCHCSMSWMPAEQTLQKGDRNQLCAFADIPCLLFLSQPGSMFSQAMKKWVQGNTDEVCPISCSSCDFTLQRNKVLMFLILAVISEYLFAAARTGRLCVLNIIWLHVCVKLVCSLPVLAGWTN